MGIFQTALSQLTNLNTLLPAACSGIHDLSYASFAGEGYPENRSLNKAFESRINFLRITLIIANSMIYPFFIAFLRHTYFINYIKFAGMFK